MRFVSNRKEAGFTLIEITLVLAVIAIFLVLAPPFYLENITEFQEKQFIDILQHDILYLQSLAITNDEYSRIVFFHDHYELIRGSALIAKRTYPKYIKIDYRQNNRIEFNRNGTILYPRTILILGKENHYRLIFPLGKGRGYIVAM